MSGVPAAGAPPLDGVLVDSPVGPIPTLLPPVVSSTWEPVLGAVPALGEHTDALLRELGRDEHAIAELHAARVV